MLIQALARIQGVTKAEHSSTSCSHLSPVQPLGQVHRKLSSKSWQVPPLRHGCEAHSFKSRSHRLPENPFLHKHWKSVPLFIVRQVPPCKHGKVAQASSTTWQLTPENPFLQTQLKEKIHEGGRGVKSSQLTDSCPGQCFHNDLRSNKAHECHNNWDLGRTKFLPSFDGKCIERGKHNIREDNLSDRKTAINNHLGRMIVCKVFTSHCTTSNTTDAHIGQITRSSNSIVWHICLKLRSLL